MSSSVVNVGFDNLINWQRVMCILSPSSSTARRNIAEAKEDGTILDVTMGRKARAVIIFDNGMVLLSALNTKTIKERAEGVFASDAKTADEEEIDL